MKILEIKTLLLALLFAMVGATCYADNSGQAKDIMEEIVQKYEKAKGVECMTIRKGSGLALVKMMLRMKMPDDFGKAFMKGVTGIIIINYIDASAETAKSLRADIDRFTAVLEEFKSDNNGESPSNEHTRSFAAMSGPNTLSAFVIAIEDAETKMMMYMEGEMVVENPSK